MKVSEAVERRMSVRTFLPDPVPREVMERTLRRAARAPSGGNVQPWLIAVLDGARMEEFRAIMEARLEEGGDEGTEYPVYPPNLHDPYRSRRFKVGEDMYRKLEIERGDKPARLEWLKNNHRFFGAPAAIFCHVDRRMNAPQWSDLGMFLQTFMLLMQEEGYDTCAQEAWARFHATVDAFVRPPADTMLFCAVAVGKRDPDHPVNRLRADRAPFEEWARFL